MPDKWEYPWYAAWDLAFHTLPISIVDPDFAKQQMLLMLRAVPLIGARHLLDMLEWDAFLATGEEIRIPATFIQVLSRGDEDAPEVFPTLPLVAQDSQAIRLAPIDEPDAVGGKSTTATGGDG
jgi:hypothetical protein